MYADETQIYHSLSLSAYNFDSPLNNCNDDLESFADIASKYSLHVIQGKQLQWFLVTKDYFVLYPLST